MSKDLHTLFKKHATALETHDTPLGHQQRFMEKLTKQKTSAPIKKRNWMWPLGIAASFLVIITVSSLFFNTPVKEKDLASVSPEMEQTQSFFVTTINKQLATLTSNKDPEVSELISETLDELEVLELHYSKLKKDLLESGDDSRVIAAMISNFQDRIALLEQVTQTIEEIKTLKKTTYETTI
jgi:hypothetical protein